MIQRDLLPEIDQAASEVGETMENGEMLMTSVAVGGTVFIAFILIWFIGAYVKKRIRQGADAEAGLALEPSVSWEEKRRTPRLAVSWRGTIHLPQSSIPVQLRDVSTGGAFAASANPLPLNERFVLSLELPEIGLLRLNAVVVWSNAGVPADKVVNRGMGIRFVDNDEASRRQLKRAVGIALAATQTLAA
jgi:hypothetical protein